MSVPVVPRSLLQHRLVQALWVLLAIFLFLGLVVRPTSLGDVVDGRTLSALRPLYVSGTRRGWDTVVRLGDPTSYVQFCLALMLVAAVRRRWRWVLVVPVTMLLSELSAQGLKQLLASARPDVAASEYIGEAAWPSGHSTAAMTVALLAILVAPRRMRPTIAVLGAFGALVVGVGMVVRGAHYPTDIFGGYLCAAVWVTLAAIVVLEWQRRRPVARPPDRRPAGPWHLAGPVLLLVLGVLTAVALAAKDSDGLIGTVRDHTVATIVIGSLVALALTLVALVAGLPETRDDDRAPDGPATDAPMSDAPSIHAPATEPAANDRSAAELPSED